MSNEKAVQVVVNGVPKKLSYRVPEGALVEIGHEAQVPLGRRLARGFIVDIIPLSQALHSIEELSQKKTSNEQISLFSSPLESKRSLKTIQSNSHAFLPDQLEVFEWMSSYYGAPLAEVIECAIPTRTESKTFEKLTLSKSGKALTENTEEFEKLTKKAKKQAALLRHLQNDSQCLAQPDTLLEIGTNRASVNQLEKKGLIEKTEVKQSAYERLQVQSEENKNAPSYIFKKPETLTASQEKAISEMSDALEKKIFSPFLLYGVTGSGKTEVYLQLIEKTLALGRSALIIVPEIALTPQLVDQFESRLNIPMALLHSQVGTSSRWASWEALLSGSVHVAIGARSAVFAPMQNLGLIIVDEEHESSYKQSEGLRYNARDVAVMRAKCSQATIVLGSATPSFESLVNVQKQRYKLIEMPERVTNRALPQIEIVDLASIKRKEMVTETISPQLYQALKETISSGGQAVILYNRRGFSSYLQCETCGESLKCPDCSVTLTYHKTKNILLCHYCNKTITPPDSCIPCQDMRFVRVETDIHNTPVINPEKLEARGVLAHRGAGTERVVNELHELFPDTVIVQMDRDTVGQKGAYREILGKMRRGEAQILVGTQMIAKGHDLPGVTLVGVLDADLGLHLPDFRASEKVFQLITQAAGRAGRGENPGRVLVQTREANHPTIVATATGRFKAFARYELEFRKALQYPPWGRLLRVVVSSPDRAEAKEASESLARNINHFAKTKISASEPSENASDQTYTVLGPTPAPHEKLRGRFRWHLMVKANSARLISEIAADVFAWSRSLKGHDEVRVSVDVDPAEML